MTGVNKVVPRNLDQQILEIMLPTLENYGIEIEENINDIEEVIKIAMSRLNIWDFGDFIGKVIEECVSIYRNTQDKSSLCKRLSELFQLDCQFVENKLQELEKIDSRNKLLDTLFVSSFTVSILTIILKNLELFLMLLLIVCSFYVLHKDSLNGIRRHLIQEIKELPIHNII